MHCGYYVCRYISAGSGVYTRFPTEEPSIWKNVSIGGIHLISYVRFPTAFVRITYHIRTIWLLHICSHVSLPRKRSPTLMNRHSILLSLSYSASSCKNSFGHRVNTMIELVTSHNIPTFVIISEKEAPWIPLRKIGRLRRRN